MDRHRRHVPLVDAPKQGFTPSRHPGDVVTSDKPSFRPRDRHQRHVPPVYAPKQGLLLSGHPRLTSVAQGCPEWGTHPGIPGHQRFP
jgi:hypothetical protein